MNERTPQPGAIQGVPETPPPKEDSRANQPLIVAGAVFLGCVLVIIAIAFLRSRKARGFEG
jgi:hypothetical protein